MTKSGKPNGASTVSRRKVLKRGAGAACLAAVGSVTGFNINHAWSRDVSWDGQPFDAAGATIRINEWGGFWEQHMRKNLLDAFEKTYNCKVAYDSSFPWFPKYVASGPKDPAFHVGNWNLNEIVKLGRIGDFFLGVDEIRASVPNAADCWDFAFGSKLGVAAMDVPELFRYSPLSAVLRISSPGAAILIVAPKLELSYNCFSCPSPATEITGLRAAG